MNNYTKKILFFSALLFNALNLSSTLIMPLQKDNSKEIVQVQQILETDLPTRFAIFKEQDGGIEQTMKYICSPNLITLVAKDENNTIIGVINYTIKLNTVATALESVLSWLGFNKIGRYINILIVEPHYQGQGVGTALIKSALQDLKSHKITSVYVGVAVENELGQKFYEKLGFSNSMKELLENESTHEKIKKKLFELGQFTYIITI